FLALGGKQDVKILTQSKRGTRKFPIGAEVNPDGVNFRVWAPKARSVAVVLEEQTAYPYDLIAETGGYFAGLVETARAGMRYRYCLDRESVLYPDLASRFQPEGPHGPSLI